MPWNQMALHRLLTTDCDDESLSALSIVEYIYQVIYHLQWVKLPYHCIWNTFGDGHGANLCFKLIPSSIYNEYNTFTETGALHTTYTGYRPVVVV